MLNAFQLDVDLVMLSLGLNDLFRGSYNSRQLVHLQTGGESFLVNQATIKVALDLVEGQSGGRDNSVDHLLSLEVMEEALDSVTDGDDALEGGQHLVGNRGSEEAEHLVLALELGQLLDLRDVS